MNWRFWRRKPRPRPNNPWRDTNDKFVPDGYINKGR